MGKLLFDVTDHKKLRVIVDTDAACEADDPFAIAHALMSPKLMVQGIVAEHFKQEGSAERSYEMIRKVLKAMDITDVPILMGQKYSMDDREEEASEAVNFIIKEALKEDIHPLFILCQGAITNVAKAFQLCPEIIKRVHVIWIGTQGPAGSPVPHTEFNAVNDITAANIVMESGTDLWVVPRTAYATMHIGIAELQRRVRPCGEIGRFLFDQLVEYNVTGGVPWTPGESWSLGDSPAVGLALQPLCGRYDLVEAPHIEKDTASTSKPGNPLIRMYKDIDSRYILEDMIAKLEILYKD